MAKRFECLNEKYYNTLVLQKLKSGFNLTCSLIRLTSSQETLNKKNIHQLKKKSKTNLYFITAITAKKLKIKAIHHKKETICNKKRVVTKKYILPF